MTVFRWGSSGGGGVVGYNPPYFNPTSLTAPVALMLPGTGFTLFFEERTGASATTPTPIGGPIGTMYDTISGRYFTAPSDVARPTLALKGGKPVTVWAGAQSLVSAAIDLSAGDEVFGVIALEKRKTLAQGVGRPYHFGPGTTANGSFDLRAPGFTTPEYQSVSRGTASSNANETDAAFAAPNRAVLSQQAKISTDTNILRIDGVEEATAATDQGTGNWGNHPLYIGGDTANFFIGDIAAFAIHAESVDGATLEAWETYIGLFF